MGEAPSNLLIKLSKKLFAESDAQRFIDALCNPQEYPAAIAWLHDRPAESPFPAEPELPFQPEFVQRLPSGTRPGKSPLHDEGRYYCLDFSSVFAATALSACPKNPELVLDMCSAPGGKAIMAWKMLAPDLLVCNEVIGKRTAALISNLRRCKIAPARVVCQDSSVLAEKLAGAARLTIVDAPCSGQSLLVKGKLQPGCFHPSTINMNANRQRRIIANSAKTVAPGGYLAYMTCTFSQQENEEIVDWLMKHFPDFQPVEVPPLENYRSTLTDKFCYRLWPFDGLGAGAFAALFRNNGGGAASAAALQDLRILFQS